MEEHDGIAVLEDDIDVPDTDARHDEELGIYVMVVVVVTVETETVEIRGCTR